MKLRASGLREEGYLMTEALVYIGAVGVLLTVGLIAMFRCVDSSLVLRRNANDIARAVHIGELWRSEIRVATNAVWLREPGGDILQLEGPAKRVQYRLAEGALYRRIDSGPWGRALEQVKASDMHRAAGDQGRGSSGEGRGGFKGEIWHWDLELQPRSRGPVAAARMRPLFTFIAVSNHLPAQ